MCVRVLCACVCVCMAGDGGLSLESMAQIKKGECAKRSNDKKEGAEGSQGNLLLPGPRELECVCVLVGSGGSSRCTCTLFAQAKVIILTIS